MNRYFADFHIHVGISESGKWVKIPTSRQLTVRTILDTALQRHKVTWHWVKGHAGNEENERADQLAREGLRESR